LKEALEERFGFEAIVGRSRAVQQLLDQLRLLARDGDIAVLLTGESGTGKELVARTLHHCGPRSSGPFVAINCGALPEALLESELFGHEKGAFTGAAAEKKGLFEVAHRGTLFLDEIGAMPLAMQVKLLRALEEHAVRRLGGTKSVPVDLRIIAASNQDLEQLLEEGAFRRDLYYRLAVAVVCLPPLRERHGDVPLLVEHFLAKSNREKKKQVSATPEALALLEAYPWPGNVRELEHVVELLVVTAPSDRITPSHLPARITAVTQERLTPSAAGTGDDLAEASKRVTAGFERDFILARLEKHRWNVTQTAKALGLSRAGLHLKMKEYGIDRN
jgi:transcriptional regulator with PAS, ATPase and Fis domain